MITNYKIVVGNDQYQLSNEVTRWLKHGYQPLGGGFYAEREHNYCQTLVKYR